MLIQNHQERWAQDFQQIKGVIEKGLPGIGIKVEHVGSTSVKQLVAKAIIDIDLVYEDAEAFTAIKAGLEKLAYYHNGDQGIPGREAFKRNKELKTHPVLDDIKHHLYVCHVTSRELKRHLAFRDYLRANEKARKEYEALKREIAERTNHDKEAYSILKETMARDFIEAILKKAGDNLI